MAIFVPFHATIILTVGNCLFLIDFVSDIEDHLKKMDTDYVPIKYGHRTADEEMKLRNRLSNIIRFHSESIKLKATFRVEFISIFHNIFPYFLLFSFVNRFTHLNSEYLFFYLACNAMNLCGLALTLNAVGLENKKDNT